jgi:hypothetical protein
VQSQSNCHCCGSLKLPVCRIPSAIFENNASSGQAVVPRLAASLAGTTGGSSLVDMTVGPDEVNAALVHETGVTRAVSGTLDPAASRVLRWAAAEA